MKKKILMLAAFLVFTTGYGALAKEYDIIPETMSKMAIVAEYENGVLVNVKEAEEAKNCFFFESDKENIKVYLIYEDEIKEIEPIPADETEEMPKDEIKDDTVKDDVSKEETKKDEVLEKAFPDIYPREKDANRAVMVVSSVGEAIGADGACYKVGFFFHGEERTIEIPKDIEVMSAPRNFGGIAGETCEVLKKGDVIWIQGNFGGGVAGVHLLYRPTDESLLFDEDNYGKGYEKLIGDVNDAQYFTVLPGTKVKDTGYGFAFGTLTDSGNGYVVLSDKDGKTSEIDVADGAIVYVCNRSEKNEVTKGTISSVRATKDGERAYDDDGVFKGWEKEGSYKFAFLRTVEGEATEIVVYTAE